MSIFENFKSLDLKVAQILEAQEVENSNKLLKLKLSLGEEEKQVVAGIKKSYSPEELIGRKVVFIANLEPREIFGIESEGMILAARVEGKPIILVPEKDIPQGSKVF